MQPGDEIIVTTLNGRYVYHVTGTEVVAPDDYASVIPTTDITKATLTLVSCTPRYSAKNRIVVRSELVPDQSDPLTEAAPVSAGGHSRRSCRHPARRGTGHGGRHRRPDRHDCRPRRTTDIGGQRHRSTRTSTQPTTPAAATPDAFSDGWFSDTSAIPPSIMWGLILAAVAYGIYWLSHKVRRYWVGVLAGFVPFIVVLYFFYENINRLLPPNL